MSFKINQSNQHASFYTRARKSENHLSFLEEDEDGNTIYSHSNQTPNPLNKSRKGGNYISPTYNAKPDFY